MGFSSLARCSLAVPGLLTVGLLAGCSNRGTYELQELTSDQRAELKAAESITLYRPILPGQPELQTRAWTSQDTAADALGRIGVDAVPRLIEALNDRDPQVRAYSARALAVVGPLAAPAVPHLQRLLKDSDEDVRRNAARALGQIGAAAKDAIPDLIEVLRHPSAALPPN